MLRKIDKITKGPLRGSFCLTLKVAAAIPKRNSLGPHPCKWVLSLMAADIERGDIVRCAHPGNAGDSEKNKEIKE